MPSSVFQLCENDYLEIEQSDLLQLYRSLNQPQISSSPSESPEPASACLMAIAVGEKKVRLYIGLFFFQSQKRMLYETQDLEVVDLAEMMVQAESFAGEMGFLLDDLRYSSASEADQQEMYRTTPFFYRELAGFNSALSEEERKSQSLTGQISKTSETKTSDRQEFVADYLQLLSMI